MTRFTLLCSLLACSLAVSLAFTVPQTAGVARQHQKQQQQQSLLSPLHLNLQPKESATSSKTTTVLSMAASDETKKTPFWMDPNTKGGAVTLATAAFVLPIIGYNIAVQGFGYDGLEAGKWIGVGFTIVATLAWVASYIFRVATKDMTYAKQLKDYENAVIAKRMEELDEDELQALVEEVERDDF